MLDPLSDLIFKELRNAKDKSLRIKKVAQTQKSKKFKTKDDKDSSSEKKNPQNKNNRKSIDYRA